MPSQEPSKHMRFLGNLAAELSVKMSTAGENLRWLGEERFRVVGLTPGLFYFDSRDLAFTGGQFRPSYEGGGEKGRQDLFSPIRVFPHR